MAVLFQSLLRLSIPLAVAAIALSGPVSAPALAGAPGKASPYGGRWTVDEEKPVFTARGLLYKTIDFAPCGKDYCGVSVSDKGVCGAVLFRFLSKNALGGNELHGHGKWGTQVKDVVIYPPYEQTGFELYLGDGHDFGGRSDSMPKYHSMYRRLGGAKCVVK
jgi:hypothetical protein